MSNVNFIVTTTSNNIFTNSGIFDAMIYTQSNSQKLLLGTTINSAAILTLNSNTAYFSNVNLGIGKSNPAFPVDIIGDLNFTGTLRQNGTAYVGSQWSNSGANVFIIGSNIGLGLSNPANLLHLNGANTGATLNMFIQNSTLSSNNTGFGFGKALTTNNAVYFNFSNSADGVATNSLNIGLWGNANRQMTYNGNGYLGVGNVGITTPQAGIHIVGSGSGGNSAIYLTDTTQTSSNKSYGFGLFGSTLFGYTLDDSYGGNTNWLQVTRSNINISSVSFPNGNVGIGTTSSTYRLTVDAPIDDGILIRSTTQPRLSLSNASAITDIAIVNLNNAYSTGSLVGDLVIRNTSKIHLQSGGGTSAITINSNNNVGIGTTTPVTPLTIAGSTGGITFTGNDPGDMICRNYGTVGDRYGMGQYQDGTTRLFTSSLFVPASIRLSKPTNSNVNGVAAFTDLVTVLGSNGYMGIGTSTPSTQLHIYGAGTTTQSVPQNISTISGSILVQDSGANIGNGGVIGFAAGQGTFAAIKSYIQTGDPYGDIFIATRGTGGPSTLTPRLYIKGTGEVGIGTTNPQVPLHVTSGVSYTPGGNFYFITTGGATGTQSGNRNYSIFAANLIGCTEINIFSDERIKKNINREIESNIDMLDKLQVVEFDYVDNRSPVPKYGLIAQEVEKYYPNVVNKSTAFIPDIFEAAICEKGVISIKSGNRHNLQQGQCISFILVGETSQKQANVSSILSEYEFTIDQDIQDEEFFIYGKQVEDFRAVDYEQISILTLAYVQKQQLLIDDLIRRVSNLESTIVK